MHITQKGQVTIPQEIRQKFGFSPNSEVEFVVEDGRVYLKKQTSAFQELRGLAKNKFSTEEIMKLTRGEK